MRTSRAVAAAGVAAAAALTIAGCSSGVSSTAIPASESAPLAPHAAAAPVAATTASATSARGNMVKQLGEEAGITGQNPGDPDMVTFSVDSITASQSCTGRYASPPINGEYLNIDMTVGTGPEFTDVAGPNWMHAMQWKTVGADGVTFSGELAPANVYGCDGQQDNTLGQLDDGSNYKLHVVFDAPADSRVLEFKPMNAPDNISGWEWQIP